MTRDRKLTFDWAIGPPKYGCVVVEWVLGFNQKYFRFHFGHDAFIFLTARWRQIKILMVQDFQLGSKEFLQAQGAYLVSDFVTCTLVMTHESLLMRPYPLLSTMSVLLDSNDCMRLY